MQPAVMVHRLYRRRAHGNEGEGEGEGGSDDDNNPSTDSISTTESATITATSGPSPFNPNFKPGHKPFPGTISYPFPHGFGHVWASSSTEQSSTFQTSTSTQDHAVHSDKSVSPTVVTAWDKEPEQTPVRPTTPVVQAQEGERGGVSKGTLGAVVASMFILVVAGCIVLWLRARHNRQRKAKAIETAKPTEPEEMKETPSVAAHYFNAEAWQPSLPNQSENAVPVTHLPPAVIRAPPPVILGPIGAGSNSAYYTGLDTSSDVASMHARNGFVDPDEPPPPYRPRSTRASMGQHMQSPFADQVGDVRSPFADPLENDAVSVILDSSLQEDPDGLSPVSDMSYQRAFGEGRPTT